MESTHSTLERLLQEQKLSVAKLSELSGVSSLALEYLLTQNNHPKTFVAQKIAKVLNVKVVDIWPDLKP